MTTLQQKIDAIHRSEYTNCGCHNRSIHRDIEEINKALQEFREQIEKMIPDSIMTTNDEWKYDMIHNVLALLGTKDNL